jgi:hypothetical protein
VLVFHDVLRVGSVVSFSESGFEDPLLDFALTDLFESPVYAVSSNYFKKALIYDGVQDLPPARLLCHPSRIELTPSSRSSAQWDAPSLWYSVPLAPRMVWPSLVLESWLWGFCDRTG